MGSVTPYETTGGKRYRVRYRLPDHSQTDKRGFRTKRDAELFLASVEVTKARGEFVSASASKIPLAEWAERWLAGHPTSSTTTWMPRRGPQQGRRSGKCGQNVGKPWARRFGSDADHPNSPAIAR